MAEALVTLTRSNDLNEQSSTTIPRGCDRRTSSPAAASPVYHGTARRVAGGAPECGPPCRWKPSRGMRVDDCNRDVLVTILALVTDAIRRPGLSTALSGGTGSDPVAGPAAGGRGRPRRRTPPRPRAARIRPSETAQLRPSAVPGRVDRQGLTIEVLTEMGDDRAAGTGNHDPGRPDDRGDAGFLGYSGDDAGG